MAVDELGCCGVVYMSVEYLCIVYRECESWDLLSRMAPSLSLGKVQENEHDFNTFSVAASSKTPYGVYGFRSYAVDLFVTNHARVRLTS